MNFKTTSFMRVPFFYLVFGFLAVFTVATVNAENGLVMHSVDDSKSIVGISIQTTNSEAAETIPAHWGKFMSEQVASKIPNVASDSVFAVYTNFENEGENNEGQYTFLIGMEVSDTTQIPEGMDSVVISESNYYAFDVEKNKPENVFNTWMEIWSSTNLNNAYVSDYEEYNSSGQITVNVGTLN